MTRYELGERIGVGGMAEIFRGTAVAGGGFEKPVAIKRILPHLSQDQRFVRLLISEAKLLSQLRHRNIVQIFDVGLGEDGQFFLVMEYVDGADLGVLYERLETARKRLPLDLALHIVGEVCDALDYAHRAKGADDEPLNLVHRDVSPGNILLSRSGEVKLTDFGIAKNAEENTGHGGVRGKFAYISPEQAVNEHVDARSDVYAAGVVLYELVLGHRLYSGLPDFDALRAVREGNVRRPREIDPQIDPRLEQILLSALAQDPRHRFQDAGKMGAELRGYRYSMEETGDPAVEIARILEKATAAPAGKGRGKRERTVVRIKTAAGFPTAGFEGGGRDRGGFDGGNTGPTAADWNYDSFDDAETNALDARHLVSHRPDSAATPTTVHEASAPPRDATTAPVIDTQNPDRAATPTVRDLFHTGALLEAPSAPGSGPIEGAVAGGDAARAARASRRRRAVALIAAAVLVAVISFAVASVVIGGSSSGVDAGPPDAGVDAAPPDALEMPPDVVKQKPKKKRRRRKKN